MLHCICSRAKCLIARFILPFCSLIRLAFITVAQNNMKCCQCPSFPDTVVITLSISGLHRSRFQRAAVTAVHLELVLKEHMLDIIFLISAFQTPCACFLASSIPVVIENAMTSKNLHRIIINVMFPFFVEDG